MRNFFSYYFLFLAPIAAFAQLNCNAGLDKIVCPGGTTTIGGSPTVSGGFPPYTISWSPSTGLNSTTTSNPLVNIASPITYTLTVKDSKDSIDSDIVTVYIDNIEYMNAGADMDICFYDNSSVTLGSIYNYSPPYTFLWTPVAGLSSTTAPRPIATPTVTTTYTVQITSPACGIKTDVVTISSHSLAISAGADTTILAGQSISLQASPFDSSYVYYWWNDDGQPLNYQLTYNPDVSPTDTTTYYLSVKDPYGCIYYDGVVVNVIPNTDLYFYNSITPNGDGENDNWVIGNLEKYPKNKLQIFNRYGQEIYSINDYNNNWDGKYLGQNLPGGTYYYVFDTKTEKGKFKGSITIYR